jgi:hypothetical protein
MHGYDWESADRLFSFGLSVAAGCWFGIMVENPKQRPAFVAALWLISRLVWELLHPNIR